MHPRAFMRIGIIVMLASLIMSATAVSAQEQQLDAESRAQLAAIPLTSSDLPSGFLLRGESFLTAVGEPESAGFVGMYLSVYDASEGDGTITSYVSKWADAEAAAAGFDLLEGGEEGVEQESLDAGDGPAELSVGEGVQDATFVIDNFVVGVSVENDAVDSDGLGSLVEAAAERATTVAGGDDPAGVDSSIPGAVLSLSTVGTEIRAGFLSDAESEALYGVRGSSLGGMDASWVSLVAVGEERSAPFISTAVTTFDDADNAARVVDQAADLVPLTIELQPVDGVAVNGAEAVRAFQYASASGDADDSFRVVMQVGSQVAVVDVQGAGSLETAQAAATSLAEAQVACMGGTCEVPDVSFGG